jgi:hypothetical protein
MVKIKDALREDKFSRLATGKVHFVERFSFAGKVQLRWGLEQLYSIGLIRGELW